ILATPNRLHVEQGLACVAAGVPALIEKPLADRIEDAERLCEAAECAGVKLLTGHHRQHNPLMVKAAAIVRSGRLGRWWPWSALKCSTSPTNISMKARGVGSPAVGRF